MIPFDAINSAALSAYPALLHTWFPAGKLHGQEFKIGNLSGDRGNSVSINIRTGRWGEFNGGEYGGDPIGLAAAAFHKGDRVTAARALGRELGVYMNGTATHHTPTVQKQIFTQTKTNKEKEEWVSSPAPANAPVPAMDGADLLYVYRDAIGTPVRYIRRYEKIPKRKKLFIPATWGEFGGATGWHNKHASPPRILYGLDRLAAHPNAVVLICEGEKSADAAQALFPKTPCITWSGGSGTKAVSETDWSPIAGRRVMIWPDNDTPGHKCAHHLRSILEPIAARVQMIHVDDLQREDGKPGADAADVHPENPTEWLQARIITPTTPIETRAPVPQQTPAYEQHYNNHEPEHTVTERQKSPNVKEEDVIPLGHNHGMFYYLSRSSKQVFELPASQHTKSNMMAMASIPYYWQMTKFVNDKGAINWDDAIDNLMTACRNVGIYNPDKLRGRGVWLDNGVPVFHAGDRLIIDGQAHGLAVPGSTYIYEADRPISPVSATPLSNRDANKLVQLMEMFHWENGISATLLAGFLAAAPICGGLKWRPSVWLTGPSKSGKTFLYDQIMRPALAGTAILVEGNTTEPGIRRLLGCDARPFLFDEAEQEGRAARERMAAVLAFARSSSSENGALVAKGRMAGDKTGIIPSYRTMFGFVSINVGIEHHADESRITVLAVRGIDKTTPEKRAAAEQRFTAIKTAVRNTISPEFCAGLLARSVTLLPIIRQNAETFSEAISLHLGDRRLGDQLGTLLSGAYSLHSDKIITREQAAEYVQRQEWGIEQEQIVERDEVRLLTQITQARIRISPGNGSSIECNVGRLISAALQRDPTIVAETADLELRQLGIRPDFRKNIPGVLISNQHPSIKGMLTDTPWATGWSRVLARIDGAEANQLTRFTTTYTSRSVWVPLRDMEHKNGDADGYC
jgi:putative DNA primase/helicase